MGDLADRGATRLATACADAGSDAPVWNPTGDVRSGTRFWLRRTLCETIIHRADGAVTVQGPAATLLLVLTRRLPVPAGLEASGDLDLLSHWVENTAHRAD